MLSDPQLIEIFKALSDPNRLQLYQLLLTSDRTNSELIGETGLRQNLLSHHLSVLADCGLIQPQQSIGDARRRYYCPNLKTALHVTHWWRDHSPASERPLPGLARPRRVLFLCLQNADRSLIAEALARHLAPHALIPYSAGITPLDELPAMTRAVLAEFNIPEDGLVPQTYHNLPPVRFDYLITVCDRVHEHDLPDEFKNLATIHWSLHDPVEQAEDEAEQRVVTRALLDEIELRLAFLVRRLARQEAHASGA
jgi:ArsR family transcriptional regulator, arsenate/arsenite/antimonite-responsive transcriptional repressor / arsenate reductase (thioredoxin)